MKHHYVPTDPGRLDLRVVDDDRRAVTAYRDRNDAAEAARGLGTRCDRQLSTREVLVLPDWVSWIDDAPREHELREDAATDRLHAAMLCGWIHERSGTRVSIEAAAAPAPWCHPRSIGSVITIDNVINARGQDHMEGGAARRELMTAVEAGGSAWLIASGARRLYLRRVDDNDGAWTATNGLQCDEAPGAVVGGLMVEPNEVQTLREGVCSENERALRYLGILECWWRGEGYRVRVERLHACGECPKRHWATTRVSIELYTRKDAEDRAARERIDTADDKTEWAEIQATRGEAVKYAGIGSPETPTAILVDMRSLAQDLAGGGWTLRTGGADGADIAFETGHRTNRGADALEVYLPWNGYNGRSAGERNGTFVLDPTTLTMAETIAGRLHPAWRRCRQGARKLHARNVAIIHGRTLLDDVDAVICWTRDGGPTGGTGMGIRLAHDRDIHVFNLFSKPRANILWALESIARA